MSGDYSRVDEGVTEARNCDHEPSLLLCDVDAQWTIKKKIEKFAIKGSAEARLFLIEPKTIPQTTPTNR
jgi:hypothetical protein